MLDLATGGPTHGPLRNAPTIEKGICTVPTFNPCTKCLAQHGHNSRPHAQLQHSVLSMDVWITSKLNVALIRKLRGSLMCLNYFLT